MESSNVNHIMYSTQHQNFMGLQNTGTCTVIGLKDSEGYDDYEIMINNGDDQLTKFNSHGYFLHVIHPDPIADLSASKRDVENN